MKRLIILLTLLPSFTSAIELNTQEEVCDFITEYLWEARDRYYLYEKRVKDSQQMVERFGFIGWTKFYDDMLRQRSTIDEARDSFNILVHDECMRKVVVR